VFGQAGNVLDISRSRKQVVANIVERDRPTLRELLQLLDAFTEQVVPILQDRGLFRTEYTGSTLREHYGLPRPESQYAGVRKTAVS
jgi:hypothetical protein